MIQPSIPEGEREMARVPSYDIAELETKLGARGTVHIDSSNRALVQNWLCAQGFPASWAKAQRLSVLGRAYNDGSFFRRMAALRDAGMLHTAPELDAEAAERGEPPVVYTIPVPESPLPELTSRPSLTEKVNRIKKLREYTGFSLRESKDAVEMDLDGPFFDGLITREEILQKVDERHTKFNMEADAEMESVLKEPLPAPDTETKLAAAAEALRAASKLAETYEKTLSAQSAILDRLNALDGKGATYVQSHGNGTIPNTELIKACDLFPGTPESLMVPRFTERTQHTPDIDSAYTFDIATTTAILLGFAHNRRVLISGKHGTGKSTHVEQVAARLNWPFFRLNLDGHLSRTDMIGRDAIILEDGKQITQFKEGLLPWAMQQPMALCLDEYDAGRPDVLFVIQRLLESSGKLTIAEQNRVVEPHLGFRIFGTANTVGLGDASGLYHGTNAMNAAQMDRWSMTVKLDYLAERHEIAIVCGKVSGISKDTVACMVKTATGTRQLFAANKISTVMSPRTVITWAENTVLMGMDTKVAFDLTFGNKCDEAEMSYINTCYKEGFAR